MDKFFNLNTKNDFTSFVLSPFSGSVVTDGDTIAGGSCAFNDTYKAFRINDVSDSIKGSLQIPIGLLNIGDRVEIKLECMSVSGVKPKIAIDYYTTSGYTIGDGNLFVLQAEKSMEFEKLGGSFISTKSDYGMVVIGLFTADIGDFYIRNIEIKVITNTSTSSIKYIQSRRMYNFNGSAGGFYVTAYAEDTCTFTIDSTNKEIVITHDKPFTYAKNGISFANFYGEATLSYVVRTKSETQNSLKVKIYDASTRALIDPATLATNSGVWFNVIHLGYDSI